MVGRLGVVMVSVLAVVVIAASGVVATDLRPSAERPDVIEIGDPVMISRSAFDREMRLNGNMAEYVELFGRPDYVEVQEVQVQEPFAPYEVRLYYLRRNLYLAFGRVVVAPSVGDYGVRKFEGPIRPETLDRILTAAVMPADEVGDGSIVAYDSDAAVAVVEVVEPVQVAAAAPVEAVVVEPAAPAEDVVVVEAVEDPEPVEVDEVAEAETSSDATLEEVITRLEAAAERAAHAADMAEDASIAATNSADRATSTLERITMQMGR